MTPEHWQLVESLFHDALSVAEGERDAWLERVCPDPLVRDEVRSLLDEDTASSAEAFAAPVKDALRTLDSPQLRRVGPYQLLEQIGRGGMGAVYKAQRVDEEYQQVVAIKIVRPGMDTAFVLRRFRRERQMLARLTHPSIARLLDGGTTDDGIPYIVMEYIDGVWITDYCESRALSLRQRIELFLPVCSAVDYAHRHFIVHRDVKPGNILIDQTGTPKLLDFGISKQLGTAGADETITTDVGMMTPDYASPEQVRGEEISPRSDVYSLGAVLYQMLTGVRAHVLEKFTPAALEEAICNRDVLRPSTVVRDQTASRKLAGDLDNILLRALHKDPERRYESAAAMADDLQRYLDDLPVRARPDTTLYRARKFARRHRGLVAATLTVIGALSVGAAVAVRQAQVARMREQQVRNLAGTFLFDVHDSIRDLPGATAARRTIVETALRYLDTVAGSQPSEPALIRELAAGYSRVADIQGGDDRTANLGDLPAAAESYRKSAWLFDLLVAKLPDDPSAAAGRLSAHRALADVDARRGNMNAAVTALTEASSQGRVLLARYPEHPVVTRSVADVLAVTGRRQRESGDIAASVQTSSEALTLYQQLASAAPADRGLLVELGLAETAVGMAQARLDDLDEALAHYQRAVEQNEKLFQLERTSVQVRRNLMLAYGHVGDVLGYPDLPNLGDRQGAERAYRRMVDLARELYEADADDRRAVADYAIASMRHGVVMAADEPGKQESLERSLSLMEHVLVRTPSNATMSVNVAVVRQQLGEFFEERGASARAMSHYRAALSIAESMVGNGNTSVPRLMVNAADRFARLQARSGAGTQALALLERAREVAEGEAARAGNDDDLVGRSVSVPRVYAALSAVHGILGHGAERDRWREQAIAAWHTLSTHRGFTKVYRQEMEALDGRPSP